MSARSRWCARLAGAALLALLAAACQTTTTSRPRPARPGEQRPPQAFFWEARSPEGGRLFLLGSVHIGDGRELALDPRIEGDWQSAEELVVELDLTAPSPVDAVEATNRHGLLPEPRTLRQVVRAETYRQVLQYMKARSYSMDRVDQMRPWMVALVVQDLEYTAAGLQAENGVDAVLLRRARGRKPIVALETLDEQMAAFASMPDGLQETWLSEALREAPNLPAFTREMLQVWEAGDDAKMSALLFPEAGATPDQLQFYDRMYWGRNRTMVERLSALAADGKARFVVVGTGHLLGDRGIPLLLAQRGFEVRRLGSARVIGATAIAQAAAPAPSEPGASARTATVLPPAVAPATPSGSSIHPPLRIVHRVPPWPPSILREPAPLGPLGAPALVQPPAPSAGSATTPAPPAARPSPAPGVHDQWLGQDVDAPAASPAVEPAPAVAPAPAPAPAPKAEPKTGTAKPKAAPAATSAAKRNSPAAKPKPAAKQPAKKSAKQPAKKPAASSPKR